MSTSKEMQQENMTADTSERLEDMLQEIEDLIAHMEEDDISLDEAFEAYQQGMKKLKSCNERIDCIEKQMLVLNEQGELEEF
ncbi:MAG: exodeoxyribonuclease VII small subunit [Lachnospiraceae bacterium]|nr:exodeoxyribonuclease VII small subunit [Lachnospiraceae bacterium]